MTSESQNASLYQGESETFTITVKDAAATPMPVDITGATLTWEMWHPLKGRVLTKWSGDGITILNQVSKKGQCEVAVTGVNTAALAPLTYWHGLRYVPLSSGDTELVMDGYITIKPSRDLKAVIAP